MLFRSRLNLQEEEKRTAISSKKKVTDALLKLQRHSSEQQNEIDSLNIRIKKLQQRRHADLNKKICQNCTSEYDEEQNFNWSCCTHTREWGGTIWWCCGKTERSAKGCNRKKHSSQREAAEEYCLEGFSRRLADCYICREKGHVAADCHRDPNIRTLFDADKELIRVQQQENENKKSGYAARTITFNMLEQLSLFPNERSKA